MRFFKSLLVLALLSCCGTLFAQKEIVKQPRILILLDGSSSMNYDWANGETRFHTASRIILALMDSMYKVNKDVEFALRVYGHQYPSQQNNCYDTKMEVMFSKDNIEQMGLRLENLHAIGVSPIAFSLKEAAEWDFASPHLNTYSLILVTDGAESCGGDICAVVKQLLEKKIEFKPYILSLVDNPSLKSGYECLGTFLPVVTEKDFRPSVGKIVEAYQQMFIMQKIDKKLLQEAIVNAPSALKVDIPKFKVTQEKEPEIVAKQEPKPVEKQEPEKPKPAITKPPVVTPPVVKAEPTKDLTDRTKDNEEPQPKLVPIADIAQMRVVNSNRTFKIFYIEKGLQPVNIPAFKPAILKSETPPPVVVQNTPAPKPAVPAPTPIKPAPALKPTKPTAPPPPVVKAIVMPKTEPEKKGETTLQVYFSDGEKNYDSAPIIALLDPKTKKEVMRFQRTVGATGVPTPQKVPAGYYYMNIVGSQHIYDFTTPANENTSITIPIKNGIIIFSYDGNPKRLMTDYVAVVAKRFDATSAAVQQPTSKELEYEPGTYNIKVNTLPPWNKTIYHEIGSDYNLVIPEEGDLIVDNTTALGKVNLYYPYGDKFRIFLTLQIDGSGTPIKLRVLPGSYKAGYKKNPNLPMEEETVVNFTVKSNNVTNLELTK